MFVDGSGFEAEIATSEGPIYIGAIATIQGDHLTLRRLVIYPTTGAPLTLGAPAMIQVVRELEDQARTQGFASYAFEAVRQRPGKPERKIFMTRRLG